MRFRLAISVVCIALTATAIAVGAPTARRNADLIKMGRSLLDEDKEPPTRKRRVKNQEPIKNAEPRAEKEPGKEKEKGEKGKEKGKEKEKEKGRAVPAESPSAAPADDAPDRAELPAAASGTSSARDAASSPKTATELPAETAVPSGMSAREARIRSGRNHPMQAAMQSPLIRLGIPRQAVPIVATAIAAGMLAFWPVLLKTLGLLLKALVGGYLKRRAKKDKKIDQSQRQVMLFGFRLRPAELASLFLGAAVFGLAISYTLKGWNLDLSFVLRQGALVLMIYYLRSFIRFFYERRFGLITQFRFWPAGGLLCLGSAYLGSPLVTVGYELEAAQGPEAAARAIRLKVWLLVIALVIAIGFFLVNLLHPNGALQTARLVSSAMALAEVMPITPMPGLFIYKWRRGVWALLVVLVVPTFFLINFFF